MRLEEAKNNVMQKAGTFIQGRWQVDMYQLTESQIQSFSAGMIKIVGEPIYDTQFDQEDKTIKSTATIRAEVDNEQLMNGIQKL